MLKHTIVFVVSSLPTMHCLSVFKDMYNALTDVGFKSSQIEQTMNSVVHYGGDLVEALDWLCLNLPNGKCSLHIFI